MNDQMYKDRVILITGTSRGIGAGLAKHFLEQGAIVEGCSRSDGDISHPNYCHSITDIADEASTLKMIKAIGKRHGRLDAAINNAEYVLRAYARLKKAGATKDCRLVFVGSKNDHLKRLCALGAELGVGEDMTCTGYVPLEDLRAIFALSDAVVHPTSVEGLGYGPEVFASGAPLITSNVPGVLESAAGCALTVPPQEVEPLADVMERILTRPDLREKLRRDGLVRAQKFSYTGIVEQLVELYETAALEHGHGGKELNLPLPD